MLLLITHLFGKIPGESAPKTAPARSELANNTVLLKT